MNTVMEHTTRANRGAPQPDAMLRAQLFEHFIAAESREQLSMWLKDLNEDVRGNAEEMRSRIRASSKYLSTPVGEFPDRTRAHLDKLLSEQLSEVCTTLGIESSGTKSARYLRIIREVGYREGWLTRPKDVGPDFFTLDNVIPFVRWHQVVKGGAREDAFYRPFFEDMIDAFGEEFVHQQFPIGTGVSLKIDFHLGSPRKGGVGVEFKMPSNTSEIHRALGQVDMYRTAYEERLLVVLFPDYLESAKQTLFVEQLEAKGVRVMVK